MLPMLKVYLYHVYWISKFIFFLNYFFLKILKLFFSIKILYSVIKGRIDQVNQVLVLENCRQEDQARYQALEKWANRLSNLQQTIVFKV